jgi:hypothetical protein
VKKIEEPWLTAIAIGSGVLFALFVMVSIIAFTGPTGTPPTTTVAAGDTTTTTTTPPGITTTTTTPPGITTTTLVDFAGDSSPRVNDEIVGEPGPGLTDVRFGAHPGFTRIVFDFEGHGSPAYHVRYEDGPFVTDGEGAPVHVDGEAFIVVTIFPGTTFDPEDMSPTYEGDRRLDPRLGPIVDIVLTGDFESQLTWVIGLTGEVGFRVLVLDGPLRVVVDLASE